MVASGLDPAGLRLPMGNPSLANIFFGSHLIGNEIPSSRTALLHEHHSPSGFIEAERLWGLVLRAARR